MKNISFSEMKGPRSYFTNFDHRIVGRSKDMTLLRRDVERNLKILLLFKSRVVCAASHLVTPFTYEILKENPELIQGSHIIPALRSDKESFQSIVKNNKDKVPAVFLDENVNSVVRWDVVDNSNWFKDRFLNEFKNPGSVIRQNLNPITDSVLDSIISNLDEGEGLSRNQINHVAKLLKPEDKEVLINYRELIYHISGARVVNCESALPQENYIDYSFETNRTVCSLSEPQIAWKIFIELALQSLSSRVIPIELLDSLSFKDIIEIRQPILESQFQSKYDELLKSVYDQNNLIGDDSLIGSHFLRLIEGDIKDSFNAVFDREMPRFIKKKAMNNSKELAISSSSIALGLAGLVPGLSLAGVIGLIKDTPSFLVNLKGTFHSAKSLGSVKKYVDNRERIVADIITKHRFKDEALLLEFVDFITNSISQKMKM